jgi:hypothetical protein
MWQLCQLMAVVIVSSCIATVRGSSILKLRQDDDIDDDGKKLKTVDEFPISEPLHGRPGNVATV